MSQDVKADRLEGESIYLRPIQLKDAEGRYPDWFNDPEVCRYNSHGVEKNTREMTRAYVQGVLKSDTIYVFAIIDKGTGQHIGNVSVQNICRRNSRGELAIILGEKEFWGRGVGKQAWELAMRFGFENLKLHRLFCGTRSDNAAMQKLALATGMKEEGRFREHVFKFGKFYDQLMYGIVRPD